MAGWIVILAVSAILYVLLMVLVMPRVFLASGFSDMRPKEECLKSYVDSDGRSSVFAPDPAIRKYIKQYVLSERNGRKVMVCKIDPALSYLEFDVAVFDGSGVAVTVLRVREIIENRGFTSALELPEETVYASIILLRADGRKFAEEKSAARVSRGRIALYTLASSILTVLEILCIKFCLSNMLGGLFVESFMTSPVVVLMTAVLCVVAVAINVACTVAYFVYINGKGAARPGDDKR